MITGDDFLETRLYTSCVRNYILERLNKSLTCTIPGMKGFLNDELQLPLCRDLESGEKSWQSYEEAAYEFLVEGTFHECFMPCKQKSYVQTLKYYHQTSWAFKALPDDVFSLAIVYNSLDVKTKTETLIYDLGDVFSAAGGNLGLVLGFSCFGCIMQLIKYAQLYYNRI